jgi:hypothetical protein
MLPTLQSKRHVAAAGERIGVAVICDFPEEHWPSMDLIGEMLLENLERHGSERVRASRVCPPFARFSRE